MKRLPLCITYVLMSLVLIGCAEIELPGPGEIMRQPLGGSYLRIGMTKEKVESVWGDPDMIRVLGVDRQGMVKQEWIYRGRYPNLPVNVDYLSETQHLFFDGDNLVGMEHRR